MDVVNETESAHTWTIGAPGRPCIKVGLQTMIKVNIGLLPGFVRGQMASFGGEEIWWKWLMFVVLLVCKRHLLYVPCKSPLFNVSTI